MAEDSWASILPSLSQMLSKSSDESTIESILRSYQLFIHICGICHLSTPRDAFLTSLCNFALPSTTVLLSDEALPVGTGNSMFHSFLLNIMICFSKMLCSLGNTLNLSGSQTTLSVRSQLPTGESGESDGPGHGSDDMAAISPLDEWASASGCKIQVFEGVLVRFHTKNYYVEQKVMLAYTSVFTL